MEENSTGTPKVFQYPWALAKACGDSFTYAAFIRGIGWVEFGFAVALDADWVELREIGKPPTKKRSGIKDFTLDRGLCVRVADIVAVADAPYGS